jgi:hypothetical protein
MEIAAPGLASRAQWRRLFEAYPTSGGPMQAARCAAGSRLRVGASPQARTSSAEKKGPPRIGGGQKHLDWIARQLGESPPNGDDMPSYNDNESLASALIERAHKQHATAATMMGGDHHGTR